MKVVGIKTLKDKLSEYVRLAAGGETVLVSDRDDVVAELGPPAASRGSRVGDAVVAEMVRTGILTPAIRRGGPLPSRRPLLSHHELMRGLSDDRADRA